MGVIGAAASCIARAVLIPLIAAVIATCGSTPTVFAQAWKPDKPIEIIIPGGAGGGPDRTARVMQKIWRDSGTVNVPINVVNKAGGGGNLAYTYLNQVAGDGHYLATMTPTLLTNHILGISPFNYTDFTTLSVLTSEYIAFAVNAESSIRSGNDLIERVRKNPDSVSFAIATSRGNGNHIALALVMKAAGIDATKLKIVLFKASIDATTAMMGGHVDAVATPASTYYPVMGTGKVRIIAIAAPARVGGQYAAVPTWKEQGINVVMPSFRTLIAPRGLTPAQTAFWDNAIARLTRSDAWKKELDETERDSVYMNSVDSRKFLDAQYAQYKAILTELGLVK